MGHPPICATLLQEDDDENDCEKNKNEDAKDEKQEEASSDSITYLMWDVNQLHNIQMVNTSVVQKVKSQLTLNKETFLGIGIQKYVKSQDETIPSQFIGVKAGDETVYIRKCLAV